MNAPSFPPPPPPPLNPARTAKRINRALFFVGALFALTGVRFFAQPSSLAQTVVGRALPGLYDEAWSAMFLVGGLLIMVGIGARRPRVELPGVTLLATSVLVYAIAVVAIAGERSGFVVVLCVMVLWVLDGRRRDIADLPRERRRRQDRRAKDEPVDAERRRRPRRRAETDELELLEQRTGDRLIIGAPAAVVLYAASAPADLIVPAIVALLGGGIVTAIAQAFLVRPQRRDLEGRLSKTAVETAGAALEAANDRIAELRVEVLAAREAAASELGELRGRLEETVHRCDELERTLIEHGIPVPPVRPAV